VKERERQYSRIYRLRKAEEIQKFRSQLDFYKNEVTKLLEENYLLQQENYILRQRLNELVEGEQQSNTISNNDLETLSAAASGIQSQIWEFEVNRYLQSSKLTDLIRFSLTEFQELVNLVTPHMNLLTTVKEDNAFIREEIHKESATKLTCLSHYGG
jgi:regulator of replication initiation timing